jgi:hypothetical protein
MRLRRTAFPTMRAAIANPRRGTGPPVLRANIAKKASAERRASRYTRSNSDFCRRRCSGLNGRAGDKPKQTSERERAAQRSARSRSDRETLATFRAAPCENQTTRSGGHAGAKAVSALTVQIARLVCTLHAGDRSVRLSRKGAPKQAHGGRKRRAARVRSAPRSVKREEGCARQKDRACGLWITSRQSI